MPNLFDRSIMRLRSFIEQKTNGTARENRVDPPPTADVSQPLPDKSAQLKPEQRQAEAVDPYAGMNYEEKQAKLREMMSEKLRALDDARAVRKPETVANSAQQRIAIPDRLQQSKTLHPKKYIPRTAPPLIPPLPSLSQALAMAGVGQKTPSGSLRRHKSSSTDLSKSGSESVRSVSTTASSSTNLSSASEAPTNQHAVNAEDEKKTNSRPSVQELGELSVERQLNFRSRETGRA